MNFTFVVWGFYFLPLATINSGENVGKKNSTLMDYYVILLNVLSLKAIQYNNFQIFLSHS